MTTHYLVDVFREKVDVKRSRGAEFSELLPFLLFQAEVGLPRSSVSPVDYDTNFHVEHFAMRCDIS